MLDGARNTYGNGPLFVILTCLEHNACSICRLKDIEEDNCLSCWGRNTRWVQLLYKEWKYSYLILEHDYDKRKEEEVERQVEAELIAARGFSQSK